MQFADQFQTMWYALEILHGFQHGIQWEARRVADGKSCQHIADVVVAAQ